MFKFWGSENKEEAANTSGETPAEQAPAFSLSSWLPNLKQISEKVSTGFHAVEKTLLSDFSKREEEFANQKAIGRQSAVAPWVGAENEEELKAKILALSSDQRNVLRDPPPGSNTFKFDFAQYNPIALVLLQEDQRLDNLRFALVPKKISEEHFWRNYFYRVSLIKQSMESAAHPVQDQSQRQENTSPIKPLASAAEEAHEASQAITQSDEDRSETSFTDNIEAQESAVTLAELDSTTQVRAEVQPIEPAPIEPEAITPAVAASLAAKNIDDEIEQELKEFDDLDDEINQVVLDGTDVAVGDNWEKEMAEMLDE